VCSDPSDNAIFGRLLELGAATGAAAEPQSSPCTQTDPTGAILFSMALSASEAPTLKIKEIRMSNNLE
jgi:hypothetical protein